MLADLPLYSDLRYPRLVRLRKVRADESNILVETDPTGVESLETLLERERRLDPERALRIAEDILVGLVAGEIRGLHHGAIRPSAVTIGKDGHAALDAFGFSAFLPRAEDFYGAFERLEIPRDRRHSRDVYAIVALLFHMVEGHPPLDGSEGDLKARFRRDVWPCGAFDGIYKTVAPLDRAEAHAVLPKIRAANVPVLVPRQPDAPPSLLDAVEAPPAPEATPRIEIVRALLRRILTGATWPVFAAAFMAALLAGLFAGPFLGRDEYSKEVDRAQTLPSGLTLAQAAETPKTELAPPRAREPLPEPAKRTDTEILRERIVALAEIGDFVLAMKLLKESSGWTPEQVKEESDAILARAALRLSETRELTRSLTADGHLSDAQREWDALDALWPTEEMRAKAWEERKALAIHAADWQRQKTELDRRREEYQWERALLALGRRMLNRTDGDTTKQDKMLEDWKSSVPAADFPAIVDEADSLRQCFRWEGDLFASIQASIANKTARVTLQQISKRFGEGDIRELKPDSLGVARKDRIDTIPLTRLTADEKLTLIGFFRSSKRGAQLVAQALLYARWGLRTQALDELFAASSLRDMSDRTLELIRRIIEEEE